MNDILKPISGVEQKITEPDFLSALQIRAQAAIESTPSLFNKPRYYKFFDKKIEVLIQTNIKTFTDRYIDFLSQDNQEHERTKIKEKLIQEFVDSVSIQRQYAYIISLMDNEDCPLRRLTHDRNITDFVLLGYQAGHGNTIYAVLPTFGVLSERIMQVRSQADYLSVQRQNFLNEVKFYA
jgi:hypothetical protein